jgi:hypothetical protein
MCMCMSRSGILYLLLVHCSRNDSSMEDIVMPSPALYLHGKPAFMLELA